MEIPRQQIERVLRAKNITAHSNGEALTISAPSMPPEVLILPPMVGRRMVQRIARRFNIDPHVFWHPELAEEPVRADGSVRAEVQPN